MICGGEHWTDSCSQKAQFLTDANVGLNVRTGGRAQGAPGAGKPSSLAKTGAPFPRPSQPGAQVSFVRDEAPGSRPHAGCSYLCPPIAQDMDLLIITEPEGPVAMSMHCVVAPTGQGASLAPVSALGASVAPGRVYDDAEEAKWARDAGLPKGCTRRPPGWQVKEEVKLEREPNRELATGSALAAAMLEQGQRLIALAGALTEGRSKEGKKIYPESFQPAMLEQLSSLGKLLAQEIPSGDLVDRVAAVDSKAAIHLVSDKLLGKTLSPDAAKAATKAILSESKQQSSAVVSAKEPVAKELAATALKGILEVRIQKRPMSFTPKKPAAEDAYFVDLGASEHSLVARDLSDDKVACLLATGTAPRSSVDLIRSYLKKLAGKLTYFEPTSDPLRSVGVIDSMGRKHCDADIMLDGGSNVNIVDEERAAEWGVKIFPTSLRLTTSNAVSTPLVGVTEKLVVSYGSGPDEIRTEHCFLVVPRHAGACYRTLIGNSDGTMYGCIHDHGAQEYILRTQFASLGLKSPQVAFPLVSRKP